MLLSCLESGARRRAETVFVSAAESRYCLFAGAGGCVARDRPVGFAIVAMPVAFRAGRA